MASGEAPSPLSLPWTQRAFGAFSVSPLWVGLWLALALVAVLLLSEADQEELQLFDHGSHVHHEERWAEGTPLRKSAARLQHGCTPLRSPAPANIATSDRPNP